MTSRMLLAALILAMGCGDGDPIDELPPTQPPTLSAEVLPGPAVVLSWTEVALSEVAYRLLRGPDGTTLAEIATTARLSYTDSEVTYGESYSYQVMPVRGAAQGQPSELLRVTVELAESSKG